MDVTINWTLVSCIFSALQEFAEQHKWSLSIGENEKLAESFYIFFESRGFPSTKELLNSVFETAYRDTWGAAHECDQTKDEEMRTLLYCLMDVWPGKASFPLEHRIIPQPIDRDGFMRYVNAFDLKKPPTDDEAVQAAEQKRTQWHKVRDNAATDWVEFAVKDEPQFRGERTAAKIAYREGADMTVKKLRLAFDSGNFPHEFEELFRKHFWDLLA